MDAPFFGTLTLCFCQATVSELLFTGRSSQVWFVLMFSSLHPRGGQNITTCKTHHVGLQSPTCVYLLVLFFFFFFDGGDRGHSATISRNLRKKKKVWVRKGERAPAGLSFHEAGRQKDGSFLIRCRAPGTSSSSCVSQPFTSINFKHIFTLFGSSSWQRS